MVREKLDEDGYDDGRWDGALGIPLPSKRNEKKRKKGRGENIVVQSEV